MDESILLFSRVYLSKFFLEAQHCVGIRIFMIGYKKEYEKSFFCETGGFGKWLVTGISREFQLPTNRKVRLYFLSCSDQAVMTLQFPTCSTRVTLLASHHSRVSCEFQLRNALWLHTFDQIFTLDHTQPLHNSHINTKFLITELQANLARNKTNTWLNKFNLTDRIEPTTKLCDQSDQRRRINPHEHKDEIIQF